MATKTKAPPAPLVGAAEAFSETLQRFGALADGLRKGELDSQRSLERAADRLTEVARCEEELQAHAQALMTALAMARDTQQAQADAIRARALEVQSRTEQYATLMRGFEALGKDAAALNTTAQGLGARKRTAEEMVKDGELLAGLDELQERMTAVAGSAEKLTADAREANFGDIASKVDSLRQQILAARNRIALLKETIVRATPGVGAS
jgi:hypothetical protein